MIYIKIEPATLIQFTKYWKGKRRQHYKKNKRLNSTAEKKNFWRCWLKSLKLHYIFIPLFLNARAQRTD